MLNQMLSHRNTPTILEAVDHPSPIETQLLQSVSHSPQCTPRHVWVEQDLLNFLGCFVVVAIVVVIVVAFKAACSHCSLRSSPCLHPSCTGLQGRATRSGCLAAIPCLTGVAAFVRKLPLVVHASHNLPARTQQHLLQSQYYVTTIGLCRAC